MLIAAKLDPYYMGIWGFVLLLIRYFSLIDFGIPSSLTVLLVQNKKLSLKANDYETTSIVLMLILSGLIGLVALYYSIFGISLFDRYIIGNLFYMVCVIAILQNFTNLFFKIYRVKGKIWEMIFSQSIIQVLLFSCVFFARDKQLVTILTYSYFVGNLLSVLLYITRKQVCFSGKVSFNNAKDVLGKGSFLFVYTLCFYLIIVSTKTIVSSSYSVEEFGFFTFSFTLARAAELLLTSFAVLITPKLLDKFNSNDVAVVETNIKNVRRSYVCLSHGLIYVAMTIFPILLIFLPKYSETLRLINLMSLSVVLYSNSFGYTSFLMSNNKEKIIARNSFFALLINILLAIILVYVIKVSFEYVIIATFFSYLFYAFEVVYSGKKLLGVNYSFYSLCKDVFPIRILIPFIAGIIVTIINNQYLVIVPLVVFIILNIRDLSDIFKTFKRILLKPSIIDVAK